MKEKALIDETSKLEEDYECNIGVFKDKKKNQKISEVIN